MKWLYAGECEQNQDVTVTCARAKCTSVALDGVAVRLLGTLSSGYTSPAMIITVDDTETFLASLDQYAMRRAGVHRTTVMRWRKRGWPPMLLRLAALEMGGHLGLIHRDWQGWRIERSNGALIAPSEWAMRPFTPSHILALETVVQMALGRTRYDARSVGFGAAVAYRRRGG